MVESPVGTLAISHGTATNDHTQTFRSVVTAGDFDISIRTARTSGYVFFQMGNSKNFYTSTTGAMLYWTPAAGGTIFFYELTCCTPHGQAVHGTQTYLRITRVGTTWTGFYGDTFGSWTSIGTFTGTGSTVYISLAGEWDLVNALGGTFTDFKGIKSSVVSTAADGILCTSGNLNGNLTDLGTSPTVEIGFLYGLSPVLSGAVNHTVGIVNTTGSFSFNLPGLTQNTFYYFRAWVNGTEGFAQGAILFFQTTVCTTICGPDPYSNSNLWTVGFLIGVALVFAAIGMIRFHALFVLSGIAVLFIAFYSFCMAGFVPAGLIIPIAIFAILQGIPVKDVDG